MRSLKRAAFMSLSCFLAAFSIAFARIEQMQAISINSEPPGSTFIMAHGRAESTAQGITGMANMTLATLPSISIYNPAGELIYEGGGEIREKNFAILAAMPASVRDLKPLPNRPSLRTMLDIVPDFKAKEGAILNDHHYVVYAITFKQPMVTTTEKALDTLRARSPQPGIDTLLLRLLQ